MYMVTSKPKRMSLYSGVSHFMLTLLIVLLKEPGKPGHIYFVHNLYITYRANLIKLNIN